MEPEHDDEHAPRRQVTTIVAVAIGLVAAAAAFVVGFLVVPLIVLIAFQLGFAAANRSKRNGGAGRLSA